MEKFKLLSIKKREMKKLFILIGIFGVLNANAQSVSYSHDDAKMNQVTVMEIGTGTLTPDFYYWALHNSYKKTATAKNKLGFRTTAGLNSYQQVDMAKSLDSAMVKRAEIEALNMADRKGGALDIAWKVEGDKLTEKLNDYKRNIGRILGAGGTPDNQTRWNDYYNIYKCAIKAMQDAYMPNSQRKKEYLRIYADICRQNETLVKYIVRLSNADKTTNLLSASYEKSNKTAAIAASAMNRWREAGWSTSSNGR